METDKDTFTLTYLNEDDRAYGLAGMAISLAALDAIDRVISVSLDAEGPMVKFAGGYFFSSSPSVSPKAVWSNMVHNFYITSAMVVSNVMARSMVRRETDVPAEVLDRIHAEMLADGADICSLEPDEVDSLYRKTTGGMRRIFANPRLQQPIAEFARTLSRRRTLSGSEIYDELHALRLI